jgi:hypothetical protein
VYEYEGPGEESMMARFCGTDLTGFIKGADRAAKAQKRADSSAVDSKPVPVYRKVVMEEVGGLWVFSCLRERTEELRCCLAQSGVKRGKTRRSGTMLSISTLCVRMVECSGVETVVIRRRRC